MTSPSNLPADTQAAIKEAIEAHRSQVLDEVKRAVEAALADVVKFGSSVALHSANGQCMCAENGGPTEEKQPFVLTSRASAGPWESWRVERGS